MELAGDNSFPDWNPESLEDLMNTYYEEHEYLCLDPNARNQRNTHWPSVPHGGDPNRLSVQQMLIDPDEQNDWVAEFEVDLAASKQTQAAVIRLKRLGPLV